MTREVSQKESSNILSQSEIDELVKEIVGIEITERDYGDDDTPIPSAFDIEDADNEALREYVNEKFKLIKTASNLLLLIFSRLISRGSLYIDLYSISKKRKSFIKYLITRFEWKKEVYRTIKKAEQQNKRLSESMSVFIKELKTELENTYLNEDGGIAFCGETVKAVYVIRAIKVFDKYVNKTFIPRVCELQKIIEDYIERLKKNYANHLPIFHIFMRKEIKVWQNLNEFITKEGNYIWKIKNELASILKKREL